jgi:glycolate dehydrogenase FAD-linked subunit
LDKTEPHASEKISHQVQRGDLINALKTILPVTDIVSEEEALRVFECDALAAYHCLPWLVLLPETTQQVQGILRICHQLGVPVVARGAGTGLAGGALPLANGVLLSMSKFQKILEIDGDNRLARVQPGVRNLAVSQAAKPYGLYYAPDPSSQIACSIGGNVAENSGGVHCLKYGLTTHNILRLKIVTMSGELVTIGSHAADTLGYDFLALMTGSEGMLGVIVEISVKLLPLPEYAQVILAAFDNVTKAGNAVAVVIAAGLIPAGLEMMDKAATEAVEAFVHAGYPLSAEAILLCEMDGMRESVEAEIAQAVALFKQQGAYEVRVSESEQERNLMWAGRKAAFPAVGRISSDYYCMDGTIPRRYLAKVLQQIAELSNRYGLRVVNVFHAGDGNLHPLILYDASVAGEMKKAEQFGGEILRLSIAVGGTITGEHGVGMEKINYMCEQFSEPELRLFHALKRAFDNKGLLNPGKAIPSLQRCAEFGAMHVHQGELAFPELERY